MNYNICSRKFGKNIFICKYSHMLLIKREKVKNNTNYYLLICNSHSGICNSTLENDLEDNSFLMQRLSKKKTKKEQIR